MSIAALVYINYAYVFFYMNNYIIMSDCQYGKTGVFNFFNRVFNNI